MVSIKYAVVHFYKGELGNVKTNVWAENFEDIREAEEYRCHLLGQRIFTEPQNLQVIQVKF